MLKIQVQAFETIYNELRDDNVYIQGKLWSKKLMKLFYDLLLSKYDSILRQIANESCKSHSLTLWEEIKNNIQDKNHPYLEKSLLARKIQDIKTKAEYKEMELQGFKLTNDEIMAIYLYSAIDELSGKFRESHRLQDTCKFRRLYQNFSSAILKMYKTFGKNKDNSTISIPETLYHGTKVRMNLNKNGKYHWYFGTISSFTSDFNIALGFGMKNNEEGNSVTVLKLDNVKNLINSGQLVAADISWMSEWTKEDEWTVLPVHFWCNENYTGMKKYKKLNNKTLIMHEITMCQSENIDHILDTSKRDELQEYYDIFPRSYQKNFRDKMDIGVWTHGLIYKHKCSKCGIRSEPALCDGKLLFNTGECPACRQVNYIFNQNFPGDPPPPPPRDKYKKVECYKCHGKYHRNQFIQRKPNIINCFDCARMNKLCLKCKNEGFICPNVACGTPQKIAKIEYILNDNQFKAKLSNEIIPMILKKYSQCKVDKYPEMLKLIFTNDDLSTWQKMKVIVYVVGSEKSKFKQTGNDKVNFDGKLSHAHIASDLSKIGHGAISTLLSAGNKVHKALCSIKDEKNRRDRKYDKINQNDTYNYNDNYKCDDETVAAIAQSRGGKIMSQQEIQQQQQLLEQFQHKR